MKKLLFLSTIVLAVSLVKSQADILYQDDFNSYADGNLVGQGGWAAHSGAGNKPVQVSAGTITLEQSAGSGEDVNHDLGATMGAGDKWFYSFDVSVSGSDSTVYFAHFLAGTFYDGKLYVTPSTGPDFTFGLGSSSSSTAVNWASDLSFNHNYQVVLAYDYDSGDSTLWVDPTSEASTSITYDGSYSDAVTAMAFRQASPSSDNYQAIDNLVVATTFQEALTGVPVPEPATTALAALGGLALIGMGLKRCK